VLGHTFFQFFWLLFIGLMGLLGLAAALAAGLTFARGDMASGIVATLMALACGLLCGIAHMSYREVSPHR
jgi:pheromone shutdown protein TraB